MTKTVARKPQNTAGPSAIRRRDTLLASVRKLIAKKAYDRADARLRRHLEKDPDCAGALYALAAVELSRTNLAEARDLLVQTIDLIPMASQPADLLATIYGLAGQINNATYYAKLTVSLSPDADLEGMLPDDIPSFAQVVQFISEDPMLNRATMALGAGRLGWAEHWYRQHLAFVPDSVPAWTGLATTLRITGHHQATLDTLRAARHAVPDNPDIISMLAQAMASAGDHTASRLLHGDAVRRAENDLQIAAASLVDGWQAPLAPVAPTVEAVKLWGQQFSAKSEGPQYDAVTTPMIKNPTEERLTVGVLLGTASGTDWAPFLAAILAERRTDRFTTVGFGSGDLTRRANLPFQRGFDCWHDISGTDPMTLRTMIASERIDILLDVAGFSAPEQLSTLGARVAPCQIVWLGSPFGVGLSGADFVLTDRFACENADVVANQPLFLELGCVLTAVPTDEPPADGEAFERSQTEGPLFAADAELAAIDPHAVAAWAAVLERVPGSTLVLRDNDLTNPTNLAIVTNLFANYGLSHRVDVLKGDRREVFDLADVVLMPFGSADPQVVVDALAANRPVVCPAGVGPFARRGASVLHHLGFGAETIAVDVDDYVAKAIAWAATATIAGHQAWRADVAGSLRRARVFDAQARAADLATALETAWSRTATAGSAERKGCAA